MSEFGEYMSDFCECMSDFGGMYVGILTNVSYFSCVVRLRFIIFLQTLGPQP